MKHIITLLLFLSLGACVTTKPKSQAHKPLPHKTTRQIAKSSDLDWTRIEKSITPANSVIKATCNCYEMHLITGDTLLGQAQAMGSNLELSGLHALHLCEKEYGCGERSRQRCGREIAIRDCEYEYETSLGDIRTTIFQKRYLTEKHFSKMRVVESLEE